MLSHRKGVLLDGIGSELVRSANGGRRKTLSAWLASIADEVAQTFTSGDATPSVLNGAQFITAGATAITDFDDAVEGQVIFIYRGSADIVITRNASLIETLTAASITLTATHPMASFRSVSGVWQEVERSDTAILATGSSTARTLADWMAGTLYKFATYAAMTAAAGYLVDNGIYCTYARAAEEDGGFGFWRYDAASTSTADSGTILAVDGGGAGRFFRLFTGAADVRWFGAKCDATSASNGTDNAAAIQLAFDWWVADHNRKLVFPAGDKSANRTYALASTCTATFAGRRGHQIIMDAPITPRAGTGDAFRFINGREIQGKLWVQFGGDTLVDYTTANPSGAQQAFYFRGVRTAILDVIGTDYDGRVVRITEESGGEGKTSRITFRSFVTGDQGLPCGQSIYVDATTAACNFGNASWFYDAYGPYFKETDDLAFNYLEAAHFTYSGVVFEGCQSIWAAIMSLGDETNTLDMLTIKGSSTPLYSGNIWIGALFSQYAAKGVVLENIGSDTDVGSITIDALYSRFNSEHGLYINNCRNYKITMSSDTDEIPIETTGACKNGEIHCRIKSAQKQAIIVGANALALTFTGNIQDANVDVAASTPAVAVNSTGRDIVFRDFDIETANANYAYDLVTGNNVTLAGGCLTLTTTAPMGTYPPARVQGKVTGYRAGEWFLRAYYATGVSHTGNTNETTLATITIPADALGANGRIRITPIWSVTNSANNKTLRVRFDGTAYFARNETAIVSTRQEIEIANRNSASSQMGGITGSASGAGSSTSAIVTSSIDTTAAKNITITGQLASSGETITLEGYTVEEFYAVV